MALSVEESWNITALSIVIAFIGYAASGNAIAFALPIVVMVVFTVFSESNS